jgi:hypothetical protein
VISEMLKAAKNGSYGQSGYSTHLHLTHFVRDSINDLIVMMIAHHQILDSKSSNSSAVSCCLDAFPDNIQQYFQKHRKDLIKQRGSYGFKNKRDDEDALCLAASFFDNRFIDREGNKRFLYISENQLVNELKETFLQKEQLAKLRSNLIAQIKQRLAYEFPEIAHKTFTISNVRGFTPIVGWLAEIHEDSRYGFLVDGKCWIEWENDIGRQLSSRYIEMREVQKIKGKDASHREFCLRQLGCYSMNLLIQYC